MIGMLHESFYRESPKDTLLPPYEIKMGVRFNPFEEAHGFYRPQKIEAPYYIPEVYPHSLVLRREVLLHGIKGYIDVITEDNRFLAVVLDAMMKGKKIERPLGETHFNVDHYEGTRIPKFLDEPTILRFSFPVHTPAEYTKLLETYADVELGNETYVAAWNIGKPTVRQRMANLEAGEDQLIVQKNLFNLKLITEKPGNSDADDELEKRVDSRNFGDERVTFVWLPKRLESLSAMTMTFNRFDQGDDREQAIEPPPGKDFILQQAA